MCHLNNNARKGPATKLCCLCQLTLLVVNKYPRKPNWPKLRNYAIRSNLFKQTANTVHLQWPISIFYSFDKTRLSYGTPPWCSTTVFIETYPPLTTSYVLCVSLHLTCNTCGASPQRRVCVPSCNLCHFGFATSILHEVSPHMAWLYS